MIAIYELMMGSECLDQRTYWCEIHGERRDMNGSEKTDARRGDNKLKRWCTSEMILYLAAPATTVYILLQS